MVVNDTSHSKRKNKETIVLHRDTKRRGDIHKDMYKHTKVTIFRHMERIMIPFGYIEGSY